ncbi:MAG: Na-translocating system protein MpsC family protein [Acidimicrobiales bacterium]
MGVPPPMEITKEQRAAIAEIITKLERDFYGRGPTSVRVSVSNGDPEVITALSTDRLTTMDRALVNRGLVTEVIAHHQAVHLATSAEFCDGIAQIVGIRPSSYLAQVDPATGYAVRVFVFAGADGEEVHHS